MNADGSNPTRLTSTPYLEFYPEWSPDGTKIAFTSNREGSDNFEIYVMNADGSGQTNISNNPAYDALPNWSPDGTKIAFESTRHDTLSGRPDIYVMNADDGSNPIRLTTHPAHDEAPDWGPATATEPPPTPGQVIDELISIIQNLDDNVPQSVKTDIIAALEEVSNILNDDNPDNDESACDELSAFINQVNAAERRDTLTPEQAEELRTQAEDIIMNQLDC
jgi:dipeptidyl aminopeptidase/acylaminoacyl peptidase